MDITVNDQNLNPQTSPDMLTKYYVVGRRAIILNSASRGMARRGAASGEARRSAGRAVADRH